MVNFSGKFRYRYFQSVFSILRYYGIFSKNSFLFFLLIFANYKLIFLLQTYFIYFCSQQNCLFSFADNKILFLVFSLSLPQSLSLSILNFHGSTRFKSHHKPSPSFLHRVVLGTETRTSFNGRSHPKRKNHQTPFPFFHCSSKRF